MASAQARTVKKVEEWSGCLNLGTGEGCSVREIIKACEKETGKKCPIEYGERRAGDPAVLFANADKAKEVLNWEPKRSKIKQIIKSAWQWEENRQF